MNETSNLFFCFPHISIFAADVFLAVISDKKAIKNIKIYIIQAVKSICSNEKNLSHHKNF